MQKSLDFQRKDLSERRDFNLVEIFKIVKQNYDTQHITLEDLYGFMQQNGEMLYDEDLKAILRRFDKDGDI